MVNSTVYRARAVAVAPPPEVMRWQARSRHRGRRCHADLHPLASLVPDAVVPVVVVPVAVDPDVEAPEPEAPEDEPVLACIPSCKHPVAVIA
jgi:hypothetical protein